jgi:uncharacterized membrane protein (UPF0127 family)
MEIKINDNRFNCKVVHKKEDISRGMMNKTFDSYEGMLFILPQKGEQSFWMKNCIIPLDIIFIDDNTITNISHNCPPCKEESCPSYKGYGGFVLELPGGTCKMMDIKKGDKVDYGI